jgi:hypothetical protein
MIDLLADYIHRPQSPLPLSANSWAASTAHYRSGDQKESGFLHFALSSSRICWEPLSGMEFSILICKLFSFFRVRFA